MLLFVCYRIGLNNKIPIDWGDIGDPYTHPKLDTMQLKAVKLFINLTFIVKIVTIL